jgi:GDP-L-fucose synthase
MSKSILITGKTGYIAQALIRHLSKDYNITSIGREDFLLTDREATNKWLLNKSFDIIIHTAIQGGHRLEFDNANVLNNNLKMFFNLFANKNKFKKFITFGSGAELNMPTSYYGMSKNIISKFLENEENCYNIRIFGVFDENELNTRFIKSNIKRYINKEPLLIHKNKCMDFFYMEDLISLVKYYIISPLPPKVIDCSYNYSPSLHYISNCINQLSDYQTPIEILHEERGNDYVGTKTELRFSAVGLEEGIKRVYNALKP